MNINNIFKIDYSNTKSPKISAIEFDSIFRHTTPSKEEIIQRGEDSYLGLEYATTLSYVIYLYGSIRIEKYELFDNYCPKDIFPLFIGFPKVRLNNVENF